MTRFRRIARPVAFLVLPAALLIAMRPIAVHAEPLSTTVQMSDLDLSSQAGINAARRRIDVAAHRVCMENDASTLSGVNDNEACRADVLSRARPMLDQLIALARPAPATETLARAGD